MSYTIAIPKFERRLRTLREIEGDITAARRPRDEASTPRKGAA